MSETLSLFDFGMERPPQPQDWRPDLDRVRARIARIMDEARTQEIDAARASFIQAIMLDLLRHLPASEAATLSDQWRRVADAIRPTKEAAYQVGYRRGREREAGVKPPREDPPAVRMARKTHPAEFGDGYRAGLADERRLRQMFPEESTP